MHSRKHCTEDHDGDFYSEQDKEMARVWICIQILYLDGEKIELNPALWQSELFNFFLFLKLIGNAYHKDL
jgi:hypothetical protein